MPVNEKTLVSALEKLADDTVHFVRLAVSGNQNITVNILEKLAGDDEFNVRCCVPINPSTPVQTLQQLKMDCEGFPCNAAMWNQSRLRGHFLTPEQLSAR